MKTTLALLGAGLVLAAVAREAHRVPTRAPRARELRRVVLERPPTVSPVRR